MNSETVRGPTWENTMDGTPVCVPDYRGHFPLSLDIWLVVSGVWMDGDGGSCVHLSSWCRVSVISLVEYYVQTCNLIHVVFWENIYNTSMTKLTVYLL